MKLAATLDGTMGSGDGVEAGRPVEGHREASGRPLSRGELWPALGSPLRHQPGRGTQEGFKMTSPSLHRRQFLESVECPVGGFQSSLTDFNMVTFGMHLQGGYRMPCPQLRLTNLCKEHLIILGIHISEMLFLNVIVHVLSCFDIKYS